MKYLIENKKTGFSIVIADNAGIHTAFAAGELNYFLSLSTGCELPVVREAAFKGGSFISVGGTRLYKSHRRAQNTAFPCGDSYSVFTDKGNIYIAGGDEYGTMYGVYGFLKETTGLKIYSGDCFTYSKYEKLPFKDTELFSCPDIPIRSVGINPIHFETKKITDINDSPRSDSDVRYAYRMRLRGMKERWGLAGHTYFEVLPPRDYIEAHPDFYVNEGRDLCLSNEQMRREFVCRMKKIIEDKPDAVYFMLGQQDTAYFCDCPKCRALTEKYGGYESAVMMLFSNAVVRELNLWLAEKYPSRRVEFCTFAYQRTVLPPVKITERDGKTEYAQLYPELRAEKNLGIMVAPLATHLSYGFFDKRSRVSFDKCFNSEKSAATRDIIYGWQTLTDKLYFWSYSADFVDYVAPYALWDTLEENYRGLASLRLEYNFELGAYSSYSTNLTELKIFVFSNMMWDASNKLSDLIYDFTESYYGAGAAKSIREYLDLTSKHQRLLEREFGRHLFFIKFDDSDYLSAKRHWTKEFLENALAVLNAALEETERLKETDPDAYKTYYPRVFKETLPVKYLLLLHYRSDYGKAYKDALVSDVKSIIESNKVTSFGESALHSVKELLEILEGN